MSARVHYIEIVTSDVDGTCAVQEAAIGVSFSAPVAELGNARMAEGEDGTLYAVRASMGAEEEPVTRAYLRVDDLDAAVKAAADAGAEIALPGMALGDRGRIAIYFHGGVQHGLWELP